MGNKYLEPVESKIKSINNNLYSETEIGNNNIISSCPSTIPLHETRSKDMTNSNHLINGESLLNLKNQTSVNSSKCCITHKT